VLLKASSEINDDWGSNWNEIIKLAGALEISIDLATDNSSHFHKN